MSKIFKLIIIYKDIMIKVLQRTLRFPGFCSRTYHTILEEIEELSGSHSQLSQGTVSTRSTLRIPGIQKKSYPLFQKPFRRRISFPIQRTYALLTNPKRL